VHRGLEVTKGFLRCVWLVDKAGQPPPLPFVGGPALIVWAGVHLSCSYEL
jgi:hypothetical protein